MSDWRVFELEKINVNGKPCLCGKIDGTAFYVRAVGDKMKLFLKYCEDGEVKENLGLLPRNWRSYLGGG